MNQNHEASGLFRIEAREIEFFCITHHSGTAITRELGTELTWTIP
jgi:hypothetical protein